MSGHQQNPFTTEAFSNRLRYEAFSKMASDINQCIDLNQIGEALLRQFKFILGHKAAKFYIVLPEENCVILESIRGKVTVTEALRDELPADVLHNLAEQIPKLYSNAENEGIVSRLFHVDFGVNKSGVLLSRFNEVLGGFSIFVTKKDESEYSQSDIKFGNLIGEYLLTKVGQIYSDQKIKTINGELQEANSKIEIQQKGLMDSLTYAKRIQNVLVSNTSEFNRVVNNNGFVYFRSKATVTGDFFWSYSQGTKKIIVLGDCTGHGVPGAFLTILAVNYLDAICNNEGIIEPTVVLQRLNEKVRCSFNNSDAKENDHIGDGMDVAVVLIDEADKKIFFSGAKRPLYMYNSCQKNLMSFKGTNMPIGNNLFYQNKSFESHSIDYKPGDRIYLSSDGFPDQFGGEFDKKFKTNQFEGMLNDLQKLNIESQLPFVERVFNAWKGDTEQTDDVLLLGVELI